ncbi:hypothetical protein F4813DRAFT_400614 [Daldinia decipiens]|uniref:uncharacterized protein n=1 Tax=Daldinia decipiens TaxID=326647 RepID=UPI0020C1C6D4|nr:uncharacterized protein F4813DRAFT_400614 [Daldinia decipiens]KAI1660337.1 hypothetical protein F4813DRAFT_400614 [Daldinia decipiens]
MPLPRGKGISCTLNKCDITIAGPLGDDWTYENVARWTTYNGGIFCNVVDKDVTHVLATPEQYKAKTPNIKLAIKYKAHIVTKDWFEDSLYKKRRLNEEDYSLKSIDQKAKSKKELEAKAQKGIEQAESFINTNLYHIYRDDTYFSYEITLTRNDKENGNVGQRYQLYLWESNAKPHLYQFAAKFYKKPRDSRPSIHRPRETPVLLETALKDFKVFFYQKTGIHWNDRIAKAGTTDKSKFRYQPPTGGKPVGALDDPAPEGWSIFGSGTDSASSTKKDQEQAVDKAVSRKRKSPVEPVQRSGSEKRQRLEKETAKEKKDDKKKVEREKAKERREEKPSCENSVSSRTSGKSAAVTNNSSNININININNKKRARACEDDGLAVKNHETAKRQKVQEAGADIHAATANAPSDGEQPEKSDLSAVARAVRKSRERTV